MLRNACVLLLVMGFVGCATPATKDYEIVLRETHSCVYHAAEKPEHAWAKAVTNAVNLTPPDKWGPKPFYPNESELGLLRSLWGEVDDCRKNGLKDLMASDVPPEERALLLLSDELSLKVHSDFLLGQQTWDEYFQAVNEQRAKMGALENSMK